MNPAAVKYHNAREVGSSIGQVLLEQGKLTSLQAEKVLQYQRESGARFGEMAVKLGFVSQMDVDVALSVQFSYPLSAAGAWRIKPVLIAASQPSSPAVEALRGLRCQLMLRPPADGKRTLAIVGQDDSASAYLLSGF